MFFRTKQQLENRPVFSMTVAGAMTYAADPGEDNPEDQKSIQQYLESLLPEEFHRFEIFVIEHADRSAEDVGELTYEVADNMRNELLKLAQGSDSLPTPAPGYNFQCVNALRTSHPLDDTNISNVLNNAPPDLAQLAQQAAHNLASLPAELQAEADSAINRMTTRYRDAIQHNQQIFLMDLIEQFKNQ